MTALEVGQLPGWMPILIFAVMAVALAWLWGSMRVHLRRADYPDTPVEIIPEGYREREQMPTSPTPPPSSASSTPTSPGSAPQA